MLMGKIYERLKNTFIPITGIAPNAIIFVKAKLLEKMPSSPMVFFCLLALFFTAPK